MTAAEDERPDEPAGATEREAGAATAAREATAAGARRDADVRSGDGGAPPLLEVRDLTVRFRSRFGDLTAVEGASVTVRAGEIVGLVGESGAGKSTIGAAVTGLLPGTGYIASGSVHLGGRRIDSLGREERHALRGNRVSMIFQDPQTSLNPLLRIGDQLVETIRAHAEIGEREARARAIALLEESGIENAAARVDDWPHTFSGGMRQRVVIALALCTDPELVIADEPTTALDVSIRGQILELIRRLADERGVGVLLVTHDIGVIAEITDRVVVLRGGRVVERGATADVLGRPEAPYTRALMAAVPRLGTKLERFRGIVESEDGDAAGGASPSTQTGGPADRQVPVSPTTAVAGAAAGAAGEGGAVVAAGSTVEPVPSGAGPIEAAANGEADGRARSGGRSGRSAPSEPDGPGAPTPSGGSPPWRVEGASAERASEWLLGERRSAEHDPILAVEDLDVVFGARPGGPFGLGAKAGFRALESVSFAVPAGGVVGLVGESGSGKSTIAKAVVGLVEPSGGTIRFAGEALPSARERPRDHPSRQRIQMIFQDPYSSLNGRHRVESILAEPLREHALVGERAERRRLAASVLELVGLPQRSLLRYPHQFSGGQRQRIAVARALLARPELLIADEPTSALDVSVQAQVLNLLKDLQATFGLSMLFVSHDLAVVRQMADRVVVLRRGRVVEQGDAEGYFATPSSDYGRELLAATPSLEMLAPP